ncbi:MAG: cytochrome P450 [Roseovarius sp.]|jgi:cytochrome P450|uniref:cytochrome P450 n=1 Tax=Roseovarius sp. TaxID=1486281 RepID=UPI001B78E19B|nr:cytochrome P450 [Roseovarius sp.]MBQ0749762.1 cytochrome P450 [Roseovarius sp.]|tara:strand:+ start:4110 stop:5372 length:1263 start_codon:yes stop_codon:yes gene_type:complete
MEGPAGTKACPIDFDHESAAHAQAWPEEFAQMRESCPVAWTGHHGGYWVATSYEAVVGVARDAKLFSSEKTFDAATGTGTGGITIPFTPIPRGLPVEADRPEWDSLRGLINRKFAPKAVETFRANARQFATALLNRVIESGEMDLVNDFTGPVPAMVTMELMGLPLKEWRQFADPLHTMVFTPKEAPEYPQVIAGVEWIFQRCAQEFVRYQQEPEQDNLLSYFAHNETNGRKVTLDEVLSLSNNIIIGGVDTTTALTAHALAYLHDHPEAKRELMEDRSLLPFAREEFLRYFTPIHCLARNVSEDTRFKGVEMEHRDRVLLAWAAANRDPEVFPEPDKIDFHRTSNRHVAFGSGIHRCIGSSFARMMFEEMMTQIFERIPEFEIDYTEARRYRSVGTINGWETMPIRFASGPQVACDLHL